MVKAFKDDVENQEYLERLIVRLEMKLHEMQHKLEHKQDQNKLDAETSVAKTFLVFDAKLTSRINDAKLNLIDKLEK